MSEDYKKIALEDVKKGQRIRVVKQYRSHIAMYEGDVVRSDIERSEIDLGVRGRETTIYGVRSVDTYILLLEDVPKPKVVRTATVKYYDDGTKEEIPDAGVMVPERIETMDQFEEYEDYLKTTMLRDKDGDEWKHTSGSWKTKRTYGEMWLHKPYNVIESCLPMTVVGNIVD